MSERVIIPESYSLVYPVEKIASRVSEMGLEIGVWAAEAEEKSGDSLLAVCVLRGGAFFFADLLRSIPLSVEPAFCRAWSYESLANVKASDGVGFSLEDLNLSGRYVLLVDDICDTGKTLKVLEGEMLSRGVRALRSVVLIRRIIDSPPYIPHWSGFEYDGPEWFVGYGMEDRNRNSNLPEVYLIAPNK